MIQASSIQDTYPSKRIEEGTEQVVRGLPFLKGLGHEIEFKYFEKNV
jgi:hypothetical protein